MKTTKSIIVVLFVLLTAQIASAYYCTSTGRWLSRDPMGEPGFETLRAANASPRVGNMISLPSARWIQRDSICTKNDPGRYAFVRNNPISLIDRFGLSPRTPKASCCNCISVQITGKPVVPPEVGFYSDGDATTFGNLMTVTWTVSGNPKNCAFGQIETGSLVATPLSGQPAIPPNKGGKYPDVTKVPAPLGPAQISYGSVSATYQDSMGIRFPNSTYNGDWDYSFDFGIDFICTSSSGTTMTGKHLDYKKLGNFNLF